MRKKTPIWSSCCSSYIRNESSEEGKLNKFHGLHVSEIFFGGGGRLLMVEQQQSRRGVKFRLLQYRAHETLNELIFRPYSFSMPSERFPSTFFYFLSALFSLFSPSFYSAMFFMSSLFRTSIVVELHLFSFLKQQNNK